MLISLLCYHTDRRGEYMNKLKLLVLIPVILLSACHENNYERSGGEGRGSITREQAIQIAKGIHRKYEDDVPLFDANFSYEIIDTSTRGSDSYKESYNASTLLDVDSRGAVHYCYNYMRNAYGEKEIMFYELYRFSSNNQVNDALYMRYSPDGSEVISQVLRNFYGDTSEMDSTLSYYYLGFTRSLVSVLSTPGYIDQFLEERADFDLNKLGVKETFKSNKEGNLNINIKSTKGTASDYDGYFQSPYASAKYHGFGYPDEDIKSFDVVFNYENNLLESVAFNKTSVNGNESQYLISVRYNCEPQTFFEPYWGR